MPKAAGKATFGAIIGIFSSLFYCFSVFYPIFATKSPLENVHSIKSNTS